MKNSFIVVFCFLFSIKAFAGGEILPQEKPEPQIIYRDRVVEKPVEKIVYRDRPVYVDRVVEKKKFVLKLPNLNLSHLVNIEVVHGSGYCPPPCNHREAFVQRPMCSQIAEYRPEICHTSLEIHAGQAWLDVIHPDGSHSQVQLQMEVARQMEGRLRSGMPMQEVLNEFRGQGQQNGMRYAGNFAPYGPQFSNNFRQPVQVHDLPPLPDAQASVALTTSVPVPPGY